MKRLSEEIRGLIADYLIWIAFRLYVDKKESLGQWILTNFPIELKTNKKEK